MNFEMVMQLRMKGSLAIWLIRKKKTQQQKRFQLILTGKLKKSICGKAQFQLNAEK